MVQAQRINYNSTEIGMDIAKSISANKFHKSKLPEKIEDTAPLYKDKTSNTKVEAEQLSQASDKILQDLKSSVYAILTINPEVEDIIYDTYRSNSHELGYDDGEKEGLIQGVLVVKVKGFKNAQINKAREIIEKDIARRAEDSILKYNPNGMGANTIITDKKVNDTDFSTPPPYTLKIDFPLTWYSKDQPETIKVKEEKILLYKYKNFLLDMKNKCHEYQRMRSSLNNKKHTLKQHLDFIHKDLNLLHSSVHNNTIAIAKIEENIIKKMEEREEKFVEKVKDAFKDDLDAIKKAIEEYNTTANKPDTNPRQSFFKRLFSSKAQPPKTPPSQDSDTRPESPNKPGMD